MIKINELTNEFEMGSQSFNRALENVVNEFNYVYDDEDEELKDGVTLSNMTYIRTVYIPTEFTLTAEMTVENMVRDTNLPPEIEKVYTEIFNEMNDSVSIDSIKDDYDDLIGIIDNPQYPDIKYTLSCFQEGFKSVEIMDTKEGKKLFYLKFPFLAFRYPGHTGEIASIIGEDLPLFELNTENTFIRLK